MLEDDEDTASKPTAEVQVDSEATLSNTTTNLNWTRVANAIDYVIEVATSQTALNQQPDIARHCAQSETSALIKHLPLNGTNVYIRIWAKVNGEWQYQDYELGTKPRTNKKAQVTRTYFIADHLGTPRFGFDDKKTQVWRWASDGFGNQAPNSDVDGDRKQIHFNFRMPGQYYDVESGLFYNWNRYYDAGLGRYVTSDPIGLSGGLNTYGYVGANPLVNIDPTGEAVAIALIPSIGEFLKWCAALGMWIAIDKNCGDDNGCFREKDKCSELEAKVRTKAQNVRSRWFAMMIDPRDLHKKAFCSPNLGKRAGTWVGHLIRFEQAITELRKAISEADANKCFVSSEDRALLDLSAPISPCT